MSSKKTIIAIAITTAALTVGSVGFASASSKSTTKVSTTRTTARVTGIASPMTAMKGGPAGAVASVLAALVAKGTITQVQADAITAAISASGRMNQSQNVMLKPYRRYPTSPEAQPAIPIRCRIAPQTFACSYELMARLQSRCLGDGHSKAGS
jgi:maltose-binding protein MalE